MSGFNPKNPAHETRIPALPDTANKKGGGCPHPLHNVSED